jgi:hypothetical protein
MNFINPLFYTRIFSVGAVLVVFLAFTFAQGRSETITRSQSASEPLLASAR